VAALVRSVDAEMRDTCGIATRNRLLPAVELEPLLSFGERGDRRIPHVVRGIAREERLVLGADLAPDQPKARLPQWEVDGPRDLARTRRIGGLDLADGVESSVGLLLVFEDVEPRGLWLDPSVDLELAQRARDRIDIGGDVGNLGADEKEPVVRIAANG